MRQTKYVLQALFIIILLLLFEAPVSAHKVTIFAYVEGGKVYTESYYVDGTKCQNSEVEVLDSSGKVVLKGKTNKQGEFSFVPPCKGPLKIVLRAGMGHRAETVLSKADLQEGGNVATKGSAAETEPAEPKIQASGQKTGEIAISQNELKKLLNETLDRKLHPILKLLVESQQHGVSARDVFAGLGYIFGIMGLVIYIKDAKKQGRRGEND